MASSAAKVFIINVNVLFLSNSQRPAARPMPRMGVYHQCQCTLFKQFTTRMFTTFIHLWVFIINVNVLFLSNSQLPSFCNFKFDGVYHQCQCTLFKQFTTWGFFFMIKTTVFIINVNVLFLSNSQLLGGKRPYW